ncbi:putative protein OS=Bosea thiooxidans OX=53254 GN=SAMN05660750_04523 PE=4 SV=1 [Bosea thiooxidans]|uniref:Uncharacterized protein n=2 Tax=Bosea thiooxidans TaxID=53254 RepID=A0A1T5GXB9_9HYPH|nr:hypothetical protein SAMN05660750_04523 [Bosea thiooxidans]
MRRIVRHCRLALLAALALGGARAEAADPLPAATPTPPVMTSGWAFRFTPYGWLTSIDGKQTVKGRSAKVSASFIDIVDATAGDGGTLIGLMGELEARKGPLSFYGNFLWSKLGIDRSGVRSRSMAPGVTGTIGAAADMTISMATLEIGSAYEVARFGSVGFDVLGGARYWYQRAHLSFERAATLDVGDLSLTNDRAIARSGAVDWLDGFVGARVRFAVAPGQELLLRGDIGGGGSRFSWQAIAAYSFDFAEKNGVTYSGVVGYRALSVDYEQGSGRRLYAFDMLQHGPILALSLRF